LTYFRVHGILLHLLFPYTLTTCVSYDASFTPCSSRFAFLLHSVLSFSIPSRLSLDFGLLRDQGCFRFTRTWPRTTNRSSAKENEVQEACGPRSRRPASSPSPMAEQRHAYLAVSGDAPTVLERLGLPHCGWPAYSGSFAAWECFAQPHRPSNPGMVDKSPEAKMCSKISGAVAIVAASLWIEQTTRYSVWATTSDDPWDLAAVKTRAAAFIYFCTTMEYSSC